MDELHYFPSLDLLIRMRYAESANSIRFSTHREVTEEEKKTVEHYILTHFGPKTNYYKKSPSLLLYIGMDRSLRKELNLYRIYGTFRKIADERTSIDVEIKGLIKRSLSDYYFDKLGDELVNLRQALNQNHSKVQLAELIDKIELLLEAYNFNSGQEIELLQILPKEILKITANT